VSENLILTPCQSLPLRKMIEAMKADDRIYKACPEVVRDAICDFYMPPYSSAEKQIDALNDTIEHQQRLLNKFALKITELEKKWGPSPLPHDREAP